MIILAIDTSNQPMSVALYDGLTPIVSYTGNLKKNHSIQLMPTIDQLMDTAQIKPNELDKIVVSNGPGSYTGLRIGMTTAKTLAWTLNIPIVTVSSLKMLAANLSYSDALICPFFDARRQYVFTGLYRGDNGMVQTLIEDQYVSMEAWLERLKSEGSPIYFLCPTEHVFTEIVDEALGEQAIWVEGGLRLPQSDTLIMLGKDQEGINVHSANPSYHRLVEAEAKRLEKNKNELK